MKISECFLICLFTIVALPGRGETKSVRYSEPIRYVIEQLRVEHDEAGVWKAEGRSVNYGGRSGAFSLLFPYVRSRSTPADVFKMLKDPCPIVRLMAAKCILCPTSSYRKEAVDILKGDVEIVYVGPLDDEGGLFEKMTVWEAVRRMQGDAKFLD